MLNSGKKRTVILAAALATVMATGTVLASPLGDWYSEKTAESEGTAQKETVNAGMMQEEEGKSVSEAGSTGIKLVEMKMNSPAFGGVAVGRAAIPEGWTMEVSDLFLGTESITCPNAVIARAVDPEGKREFIYISRREFEERTASMMSYETKTEDDSFDLDLMMHVLDYREADDVCDLMTDVMYGSGAQLLKEKPLSAEDEAEVEKAREAIRNNVENAFEQFGLESYGSSLVWTDATAAGRTYLIGDNAITTYAASSGYDMDTTVAGANFETIFWSIPAVFIMRTPAQEHETYEEAFRMFRATASTSKEFEKMRDMNSQRLATEWISARMSGGSYDPSSQDLSESAESTIEQGDKYEAIEGWDDVIRDETDYITADGSHVKVSDDWEHVFEGEDGTLYLSGSPDGPAGTTELNPTQIGE